MSNDKRELAKFLKEVSGWDWAQFLEAESDEAYTTRQSIVFSMIRAAAMENLIAISTAINRLDGKVETPVQFIYPKVYYLYPNAVEVTKHVEAPELRKISPTIEIVIFTDEDMEEMPSQSFRETMEKMATQPRGLPAKIIACQEAWEEFTHGRGPKPNGTVKVSSVVAARLLRMAQKRDMKALDEVFNQLDGKLVEKVKIVGEDMYIMQWSTIAPAGAEKNEDGVYQIEAPKMAKMWGERLDVSKKGLNQIIIEED